MAFTPSKRKADAMAMYSPSPKKAKVLTLEERIKVLEKSESGICFRYYEYMVSKSVNEVSF